MNHFAALQLQNTPKWRTTLTPLLKAPDSDEIIACALPTRLYTIEMESAYSAQDVDAFISLHHSLMCLVHDNHFIERNKTFKLQCITRACAEQLNVNRVSIWRLNEQHDAIVCEQLYQLDKHCYESGAELHCRDFPSYFTALNKDCIIYAYDAQQDKRTSEFTDSYLKPLNIHSMLDIPVFFKGVLFGVICIEQTGCKRHWAMAELAYAASLADTLSLINEHEHWLITREEMAQLGSQDTLTGLNNRRYLHQWIDKERQNHLAIPSEQSQRSLIVLGLDSFTTLNDHFGHKIADDILTGLGLAFENLCNPLSVIPARIGGDMFAFWLSHSPDDDACEHLLMQLQQLFDASLPAIIGSPIEIQASFGVASMNLYDDSLQEPIRCGEIALAQAKKNHRGSTVHFQSKWLEQMQAQKSLEKEVYLALQQNQLRAWYQPLIDTQSGKVIGLEALVRWAHPERGMIPPGVFLPVVSDLGLMVELSNFMLEQACADMHTLLQQNNSVRWVAVNLSAEQLADPFISDHLQALLNQYQLPSSALELEVVEELISTESELLMSQLNTIDQLGIKLAIDDFGTGYSSLSRLKYLPVSKLKIDKSFVDGLPTSEKDCSIAQSIIGLGRGMGVKLVAEGVEHQHQADWLGEQGVDYLQGYHFAAPMSFDKVLQFCREH